MARKAREPKVEKVETVSEEPVSTAVSDPTESDVKTSDTEVVEMDEEKLANFNKFTREQALDIAKAEPVGATVYCGPTEPEKVTPPRTSFEIEVMIEGSPMDWVSLGVVEKDEARAVLEAHKFTQKISTYQGPELASRLLFRWEDTKELISL